MNESRDWTESVEKRVRGDLKEESLLYSTHNKRHERGRGEQQREHREEFRCVCVYLWGVGDSECDHVFAGVFNEEVMLIQQLHLPHPQPPQLIKKLEESDDTVTETIKIRAGWAEQTAEWISNISTICKWYLIDWRDSFHSWQFIHLYSSVPSYKYVSTIKFTITQVLSD